MAGDTSIHFLVGLWDLLPGAVKGFWYAPLNSPQGNPQSGRWAEDSTLECCKASKYGGRAGNNQSAVCSPWQPPAFRNAVGAVDGCHVWSKAPGEPEAQCYKNRKLCALIQMQAVCDHEGNFVDIHVGFPGSVHDARVLRHSKLYREATYPPPGWFLLGDGGYPCLDNPIVLITPYKKPVRSNDQAKFNRLHSKAHCVIERAFGIMKTRWRDIYLKALEIHPTFALEVIAACATLYNICLGVGDIFPAEERQEESD